MNHPLISIDIPTPVALLLLGVFIVWFIRDSIKSAREGTNGFVVLWNSLHGWKFRMRMRNIDTGEEWTLVPCPGCQTRLKLGRWENCPFCNTPMPKR